MQQALYEAGRLLNRHAEQNLDRHALLDGGDIVALLPATLAYRDGIPALLGVEPSRQRTMAFQRFVIGQHVSGVVVR
tara:strand:+ start:762 stop:992 length:231 start_codon:yes stop_codon:yes gene_type:complete